MKLSSCTLAEKSTTPSWNEPFGEKQKFPVNPATDGHSHRQAFCQAPATRVNHGKTRKIDPEAKFWRVLDCSLHLFVEKGYHRVSIPDIVAASGVSTGAIYNLFSNKECLARTLHQQVLEGFHDKLIERLLDCETAYEKLRAFALLIFELTDIEPITMEYLLFMKHSEFMHCKAPICLSEPFRLIRDVVRDGMASGEIRQGDYFVSAASYTGAILRPVQLKLECALGPPLSDLADDLITNAWAAIKA